ncbi:MAG TPA: 50S ribosomal protein L19 [Candidatus Polarisedimenticolia bacterium]|nr:50S ribosomal protein L19 [Candidatus Polarisedimenticolia bacterium]
MDVIKTVEDGGLKKSIPAFTPGDMVKVSVRVKEGDKERIQVFQGVVMGLKGGGLRQTFTVRKVSDGVGVERIFPLHSPSLGKIEVVQRGKNRRAKLYYLKKRKGKAARIKAVKEKEKPVEPVGA